MKKILLTAMTWLLVLSASAQDKDKVSSVENSEKLNFEMPLFGIRVNDVKPMWSLTGFAGFKFGIGFRQRTPEQMNNIGMVGECDLIEIRYRPWCDGNMFSAGFTYGGESYKLKSDYSFDHSGGIIKAAGDIENHHSFASAAVFGLNLGYTHEWGAFKTGLFVIPGYGYTLHQNNSVRKDVSTSVRVNEFVEGNKGFRLSISVGLWYEVAGVTVDYSFGHVGPCNGLPRYDRLAINLLFRY